MGILARCGCGGGQCNCAIAAGENVTIGGSGSVANPYIINAVIGCEDVRPCISGTNGVEYDLATGVVSADLSGQAGNNITLGPDGGLFVPTGAATVSTGCGLTGDGSGGSPVKANTGVWPYPCDAETHGGVVVCDANGVLRSEPRGQVNFFEMNESRNYPNRPVPAALDTIVDTFSLTFTNPDTCRPAFVMVEREVEVDFNLPVGAGAGYGHDTDDVYYMRNTGTSAITNIYTQTTKVYRNTSGLPPGGATTISLGIGMGRGSGGATYSRIQCILRAFLFSL